MHKLSVGCTSTLTNKITELMSIKWLSDTKYLQSGVLYFNKQKFANRDNIQIYTAIRGSG